MKCYVLTRGENRTIVAVTTNYGEALDWACSEISGTAAFEVPLNGNFRVLLERETDR